MIQIQLINNVIEWEKALQLEEARRENHCCEPYVNYLAAPPSCRKERKSASARIFKLHRKNQSSADYGFTYKY